MGYIGVLVCCGSDDGCYVGLRLIALTIFLQCVTVFLLLLGEYERVQKKAFTNWVNSHLIKVSQCSLYLMASIIATVSKRMSE